MAGSNGEGQSGRPEPDTPPVGQWAISKDDAIAGGETSADSRPRGVARIVRSEGRRALAVDGVVQSIEVVPDEPTPGYWPYMVPDHPVERGLMLGFGGGTIARLLLDANHAIKLLAVDDDGDLLATVRRSLRLRIDDPRLTIRVGDAFATSRELLKERATFDYIAIDLYRAAVFDRGAIARPFLRRMRELCTSDGIVAFNLIRNGTTGRRLRRIAQYLRIVETRLIGLNCVIHTRPISD